MESSALCFHKDEFMHKHFSVDTFVSEHRKHASLEKLRDDLGVHLKVLRSSMIELINKDYADFVNLSSNLVGLDKFINNISSPLGQLREEILDVKATVDEMMNRAKEQLQKRRQIQEKKALLQQAMAVYKGVEKVEKLVPSNRKDGPNKWSSEQVEQVATEVHQLLFYVSKCQNIALVGQLVQRINAATLTLQRHLEQSFLQGLKNDDQSELSSVLRICAAVDKIQEMEALFRKKIVKPSLDEIIAEKVINEVGIQGMYNQVIMFISTRCRPLLDVTRGNSSFYDVARSYDFLVNSVWLELVFSLETRVPLIFSPGNPAMFHERFSASMAFLDQFEHLCHSVASVNLLRSHQAYENFLGKWNLPVYFQLRFQEIASALETSLSQPIKRTSGGKLHITCSEVLWEQLQRCWHDDVYLPPLAHRFWKLTFQLLSRYHSWICSYISSQKQDGKEDSPAPESGDAIDVRPINNGPNLGIKENDLESSTTVIFVLLYCDIETLTSQLPVYYEDTIKPKLEMQGFTEFSVLEDNIQECTNSLNGLHPQISEQIVKEVIKSCNQHLKLVNSIPRLYRRTNREVPSKASSYVQSVLQPLEALISHTNKSLGVEWKLEWTRNILEKVTEKYTSVTSDVLLSVKKMEDSLKRLKRARDKKETFNSGSTGMSDDDKIRFQLWLDVESYGKQIRELGVQSSLPNYENLVEIVEAARNSPSS